MTDRRWRGSTSRNLTLARVTAEVRNRVKPTLTERRVRVTLTRVWPTRTRPPADLITAWTTVVGEVDPLTALRAARDLKEQLGSWEADLARQALAAGETWDTIGAALGISRQAAWERLRPRIAAAIDADRERIRSKRARVKTERSSGWKSKNAKN